LGAPLKLPCIPPRLAPLSAARSANSVIPQGGQWHLLAGHKLQQTIPQLQYRVSAVEGKMEGVIEALYIYDEHK
jgi:hypothetical protein